jgi:hypothetical protein
MRRAGFAAHAAPQQSWGRRLRIMFDGDARIPALTRDKLGEHREGVFFRAAGNNSGARWLKFRNPCTCIFSRGR